MLLGLLGGVGRGLPVENDFGLFKVPAGVCAPVLSMRGGVNETRNFTFVDENQTEVIAGGVFLVDFSEGRGQIEPAKEETDRDGFSCLWVSERGG